MLYHAFFASKALHISLVPPDDIRDVSVIAADIQYNDAKDSDTDKHDPDFLKLHKKYN